MQKDDKENVPNKSSLSGDCLEAEDVLSGSEPWDPVETKMIVWSFVIAAVALVIGLFVVPTSILH